MQTLQCKACQRIPVKTAFLSPEAEAPARQRVLHICVWIPESRSVRESESQRGNQEMGSSAGSTSPWCPVEACRTPSRVSTELKTVWAWSTDFYTSLRRAISRNMDILVLLESISQGPMCSLGWIKSTAQGLGLWLHW